MMKKQTNRRLEIANFNFAIPSKKKKMVCKKNRKGTQSFFVREKSKRAYSKAMNPTIYNKYVYVKSNYA